MISPWALVPLVVALVLGNPMGFLERLGGWPNCNRGAAVMLVSRVL